MDQGPWRRAPSSLVVDNDPIRYECIGPLDLKVEDQLCACRIGDPVHLPFNKSAVSPLQDAVPGPEIPGLPEPSPSHAYRMFLGGMQDLFAGPDPQNRTFADEEEFHTGENRTTIGVNRKNFIARCKCLNGNGTAGCRNPGAEW